MIALAAGLFIGAFIGFMLAAILAMTRGADEDARDKTISRAPKIRS